MLKEYGFLRVGAIVNKLELLNVEKNVETIKELVDKSIELGFSKEETEARKIR